MANQIGKFFTSQGTEQAVTGTADHIRKFWDPHMRASIAAHLEARRRRTGSERARAGKTAAQKPLSRSLKSMQLKAAGLKSIDYIRKAE